MPLCPRSTVAEHLTHNPKVKDSNQPFWAFYVCLKPLYTTLQDDSYLRCCSDGCGRTLGLYSYGQVFKSALDTS